MKKNFTVNLGNRLFQIDEDAYDVLQRYIESIHTHFKYQQGGEETANDIEERIAEHFEEIKSKGYVAITIENVRNVIDIIGTFGTDGQTEDQPFTQADEQNEGNNRKEEDNDYIFSHLKGKKFYRNPKDKMIAGVMSGLAKYFGGDVTLWRLAAVIFTLVFMGTGIIAYLACALIIPEDPSLTNKTSAPVNDAAMAEPKRHGCLGTFVKILFIILAIGSIVTFITYLLSLLGLGFGFASFPFGLGPSDCSGIFGLLGGTRYAVQFISFVLVVMIPIYVYLQKRKVRQGLADPMSKNKRIILLILWICLIFVLIQISSGLYFNYSYNTTRYISPFNKP
jgi:phage shock protein PspC (stress-responsive transcriptional regulator)